MAVLVPAPAVLAGGLVLPVPMTEWPSRTGLARGTVSWLSNAALYAGTTISGAMDGHLLTHVTGDIGIALYPGRDGGPGRSTLSDPVIGEIAAAHGKSPAQVMLRRHLQQGRQVIPKSVTLADRREHRRLRLRSHR